MSAARTSPVVWKAETPGVIPWNISKPTDNERFDPNSCATPEVGRIPELSFLVKKKVHPPCPYNCKCFVFSIFLKNQVFSMIYSM